MIRFAVGTMLIERNKVLPARSLYGIDIYGQVSEGAREYRTCGARDFVYTEELFDFTSAQI